MIDIKAFRKANNLKQQELAQFLGATRSFISLVETGRSKFPDEMLAKLLTNKEGWDTSMLSFAESPKSISATSSGGNASIHIGSNNIGNNNLLLGKGNNLSIDRETDVRIAVLEAENKMLKQQIADKDAQIEFLKSLIVK